MQLRTVFVQNLKKYRKYRKISQMTLAEKCGTSTSYIGQIEIGNRFPSLEMIEKMAEALQVRPYLLFFDELEKDAAVKLKPIKKDTIPDAAKEELFKHINAAIHKVVKKYS